jgi:hypothetical protein
VRSRVNKKHLHPLEYATWQNILRRCEGKTSSKVYYADRGIAVCERWLHSFDNFLADMGPKPEGPPRGWSIERVNNDKGYAPDNCKWATPKEQAQNRRPRNSKSARAVALRAAGVSYADIVTQVGITYRAALNAVYKAKGRKA